MLKLSQSFMWRRFAVSAAIGIVSTLVCWALMVGQHLGAADFNWALRSAHDLISGHDPYSYPFSASQVPYPLPAAIFGLPFIWFKPELGGSLFFGLSSALLAFGLIRDSFWRLLIFLSWPYWSAMLTVQFAPLVMAGALIPSLLPASMAKPQIGLPVGLTHLTRRGVLACVIVLGVSLIFMPTWPLRWISQIGSFQHFVPLLVLPGPALLLAIWRRKDPDSHLLLLTAMVPQRWFYESFVLWLIPKTRQEILATVCLSWGAGIWRWYHMPRSWDEVGAWTVLWIYLPMLTVILLRGIEFLPFRGRNVISHNPVIPEHRPLVG